MTRMISAIYENGAFRPTEPIGDLPEHVRVQLTVTSPDIPPKRALGLQRDKIIYVAPDFDEELGDDLWFGNKP